jgi:hypothetical protein
LCALIRVNKKRKISYPADIMTSDKALASIEIASNGVKSRGWVREVREKIAKINSFFFK